MALEKLKIIPFTRRSGGKGFTRLPEITTMFNPENYSVSKSVSWTTPQTSSGASGSTHRLLNAPPIVFSGGGSRTLTLSLFFDVSQPTRSDRQGQASFRDVREETNKIVRLTRIQRGEDQPPVCEVSWGQAPVGSDFPFIGVITSLTQRFTLFREDGKPLRAELTVSLLEFLDPELDQRKTDPELTSRIVKAGDTLSSIAAEVYQDPTLWRVIADANRIVNPRHVSELIGRPLTIPKLL